jgi:hypothetical protein
MIRPIHILAIFTMFAPVLMVGCAHAELRKAPHLLERERNIREANDYLKQTAVSLYLACDALEAERDQLLDMLQCGAYVGKPLPSKVQVSEAEARLWEEIEERVRVLDQQQKQIMVLMEDLRKLKALTEEVPSAEENAP